MMQKLFKGFISVVLMLVVLLSALPVSASAQGLEIRITPSVTNAAVGDVIEYTVTATGSDILAMEFKLVFPEGLRYVEGSGCIPQGLKELLNWAEIDWTEETQKWTGFNDIGAEFSDTVIMTFSAVAETVGSHQVEVQNIYPYNSNFEEPETTVNVGRVTVSVPNPTKVTGLQVTNITETSFDLSWDAIEGALKYWVYLDGAPKVSTTDSKITVTKCTLGTVYQVKVIARLADGTMLTLENAEALEVQTKAAQIPAPAVTATAEENSITLSWDATGCAKTWIYMGTDPNALKLMYSCTAAPYKVTGLKSGMTYYFRLSHSINGQVLWTDGTLAVDTLVVNNPTKVTGLKTTNVEQTSFAVTWDAIEGATKYWVYIDGAVLSSTTTNSATVSNRTSGTSYRVQVIARLADNTVLALADADALTVKTQGQALTVPTTTVTAGPGSLTLKWDNTNCTKTWIYLGTTPDNLALLASCTADTYTAVGLESGTTYYVRMSHFMGGRTMVSDELLEATIQTQPDLTVKTQLNGSTLTLDWEANADSYKYWITVVKDGKTMVYSTKDTGFTLEGFDPATCTVSIRGIHSKGTYDYDRVVV